MRENRIDVAKSTRDFFIRGLEGHSAVMEIVPLERDLYLIKRTRGLTDIKIYIADIYIAGEADILEISCQFSGIECIVLVGYYNRYSNNAKGLALSRNIALYDKREFFCAVNYEGDAFLNFKKKE